MPTTCCKAKKKLKRTGNKTLNDYTEGRPFRDVFQHRFDIKRGIATPTTPTQTSRMRTWRWFRLLATVNSIAIIVLDTRVSEHVHLPVLGRLLVGNRVYSTNITLLYHTVLCRIVYSPCSRVKCDTLILTLIDKILIWTMSVEARGSRLVLHGPISEARRYRGRPPVWPQVSHRSPA